MSLAGDLTHTELWGRWVDPSSLELVQSTPLSGADEVVVVSVDVVGALSDSFAGLSQQRLGFGHFCLGGEFEA